MTAHLEPNANEKKIINNNYTHGNEIICIIGDHSIRGKNQLEYHHIKPVFTEGNIDISNIAVVCKGHHREIGQLSISEYKTLKEMENFFKSSGLVKLNDVIKLKLEEKPEKELSFEIDDSGKSVKIKFNKNFTNSLNLPLYTCPATAFKYFYAVLPVGCINNDEELQPRPLELKRLWDLYRHLLVNSQLTPSVCRLMDNKIFLFDGQHKTAAQIWAGREEIECKVYINPSIKMLKEANLIAHDKLRQMPFFTSVLINKWASIFSEEWGEYLEMKGEKSEAGFVSFLVNRGKKRSEAVNMIESNIHDSIIEDKDNEIMKYMADYNINIKKPMTVNRLKQVIFKKFIAILPLDIDIEESDRLRELERRNLIIFLNLIAEYTLKDKWNPEKDDELHRVSERIYLNGSFKAWSSILRDIIATILELYEENERKAIFLREIGDDSWNSIEQCIKLIFERRVWLDESQENYNNLRLGNENLVRRYLARRGINVNEIMNNSGITENSNWMID